MMKVSEYESLFKDYHKLNKCRFCFKTEDCENAVQVSLAIKQKFYSLTNSEVNKNIFFHQNKLI